MLQGVELITAVKAGLIGTSELKKAYRRLRDAARKRARRMGEEGIATTLKDKFENYYAAADTYSDQALVYKYAELTKDMSKEQGTLKGARAEWAEMSRHALENNVPPDKIALYYKSLNVVFSAAANRQYYALIKDWLDTLPAETSNMSSSDILNGLVDYEMGIINGDIE
jgi:hypothetical protein